jgi:hypothetical protein
MPISRWLREIRERNAALIFNAEETSVAADPKAIDDSPQTEAYERYVHENWDKLQPWEQQQAQAFLTSQQHGSDGVPRGLTVPSSYQPFLNDVARPFEHPELYWTIKCGWACVIGTFISPAIFGPLGFFFGIYNFWKGDQDKGIIQVALSLLVFVVMMVMLMAGQEIMRKLIPGPEFLLT